MEIYYIVRHNQKTVVLYMYIYNRLNEAFLSLDFVGLVTFSLAYHK